DRAPQGREGIERRPRALKVLCHRRAVQMAETTRRYPRDVLPAKPDMACRDPPGRIEQPRDRKTGDGLARAALADKAEHLALAERQRNATYRLDKPTPCREGDVQVAQCQQRLGHVRMRGSRISRTPSPSRLKHST